MLSQYLDALRANGAINDGEYVALSPMGLLSADELYAVTLHFPSLARTLPDGNVARLSALAALGATPAFKQAAMAGRAAPVRFSTGALQGDEIEVLRRSNYDLAKIGTNLNQIAKAFNLLVVAGGGGKLPEIGKKISSLRTEIKRIPVRYCEFWKHGR